MKQNCYKAFKKPVIVLYGNFDFIIQFYIFVFPSFLPFFSTGHCFKGWSEINLKVYDVIHFLNKNLITHNVWYLEKEKVMTLKLCELIEY